MVRYKVSRKQILSISISLAVLFLLTGYFWTVLPEPVLVFSIPIRLAACLMALAAFWYWKDWRTIPLALMFFLMAARQMLTLFIRGGVIERSELTVFVSEFPGFIVTLLSLTSILYIWKLFSFEKIAEDAVKDLETSEEKFKTMADSSYDWDIWHFSDGKYVYMSPSCERITGYRQEDFYSSPDLFLSIVHPEDRENVRLHQAYHFAYSYETSEITFRIIKKTGEICWIWHQCQAVTAKDGSWKGRRETNRDITRFKEIEEKLRKSENRLRQAQKVAKVGHWEFIPETKELYWSDEIYRIFGLNRNSLETTYEIFVEFIHPDDRTKVLNAYNESISNNTRYEIEHRIVLKNNQQKWVRENCITDFKASGEPIRSLGTLQDITRQKELEERLNQALFERDAITGTVSDIMYMVDGDMKLTWWNRSLEKITGKSKEQMQDCNFADFFIEKDRKKVQQTIKNIFHHHYDEIEVQILTVQGPCYYQLNGVRMKMNGKPFMVGTGRDLTVQKKNQEVMRNALDETKRLNRHMEGQEERIAALKARVNQFCEERQIDPIFNTDSILLDREDSGTEADVYENERLSDYINIFRLKEIFQTFSDATGLTTGLVEVPSQKLLIKTGWRSICTDFHRAFELSEENCKTSNKILNSSLTSPGEIAIYECNNGLIDGATPIIINNRHMANLFSGQIFFEAPCRERFLKQANEYGYDEKKYMEALDKVPIISEERFRITLGFLAAFSSYLAETAMKEKSLIITAENLRRSRKAMLNLMDDLNFARKKAEAASHAKSVFLSNMSHELRTPLNAILGYTQILSLDNSLSGKQKSSISTMHHAGEHLLQLINDILDMSKIEARKMELTTTEFWLPQFLKTIHNIIKVRADKKNLQFNYNVKGELPEVIEADELRLRQVLLNLLSNAVKFTDKGSCVLQVESEKNKTGIYLLSFIVEDTGIGIAVDMQETIFAPFHQIKDRLRHTEGTGLGLAISRKLVRLMGGELKVESPINKSYNDKGPGCRFSFSLEVPAHRELTPALFNKSVKNSIGPGDIGSKTVLIVDDEASNRAVLRDTLEPFGFSILESVTGHEALDACERYQPDVILMDLQMPVMDGFEATARIKENPEYYEIPVIAVTAASSTDEQFHEKYISAGFSGYIQKPYNVNKLLEVVAGCMNLKFVYEEDDKEANEEFSSNSMDMNSYLDDLPPLLEIELLLNLTKSGDIFGVSQKVSELSCVPEKRYNKIVNKIKMLTDECKLSELEEFLSALVALHKG